LTNNYSKFSSPLLLLLLLFFKNKIKKPVHEINFNYILYSIIMVACTSCKKRKLQKNPIAQNPQMRLVEAVSA
jgi:hypothetical protein